ncbi:MAG: assimilatory sulfite reductase (NADPH) flavoprotein subunit [Parvibaculum sp.]|uniref:assimilatory sulfite reductase (NADPH) flavoprotein subunit n=1 Tax=Parvibaculum sp. TaxID=2024848 RepID=UPI003C73A9C3
MNMSVPALPGIGLNAPELAQLEALSRALRPDQMLWASGYLAGIAHARLAQGDGSMLSALPPAAAPSAAAQATSTTLSILYASETGNAADVARRAEAHARGLGLTANAFDLATYKPRNLANEQLVLIVSSTHGEGEPPEPAIGFFEFIDSRKAPKLEGIKFAVLGLGDSTYEFFCEAAKRLDRRFEELGATRFHDRIDCDVDYEEPADAWLDAVLGKLKAEQASTGAASSQPVAQFSIAPVSAPEHDKRNPLSASVVENLVITGRGSSKETRHIEFSLEGSNLVYAPGDALGILPRNDPSLIDEVMERAGLSGSERIATKTGDIALSDALSQDYEITALTPRFLQHWAEISSADDLRALTAEGNRKELAAYMQANHIIDVMRRYPVQNLNASDFVGALRGLQPRLYSIASSQLAAPDEVHITVSTVRYELHGTERMGVASCHLADRVRPDDILPVYIQRNDNFRLPNDPSTPIIMIGAGTGVAPFRSFVQQREAEEAEGKSWLIFGERNFRTDFLYQTDWQGWLKDGALHRMDVAFSRDQAEKRYVQHVIAENGADLFAWLEEGAHFYMCGDAEKLAPDVHDALLSIIEAQGAVTREGAEEYLRNLQRDGRYQRDVY